MALLEKEAIRFAESLDDYEHVEVIDIGGNDPHDYWLVVRDHRFDLDYELTSHCDYWDLIGATVEHRQCHSLAPRREEVEPQERTNSLAKCVRNEALRRRGRNLRKENRPKTARSEEAA